MRQNCPPSSLLVVCLFVLVSSQAAAEPLPAGGSKEQARQMHKVFEQKRRDFDKLQKFQRKSFQARLKHDDRQMKRTFERLPTDQETMARENYKLRRRQSVREFRTTQKEARERTQRHHRQLNQMFR